MQLNFFNNLLMSLNFTNNIMAHSAIQNFSSFYILIFLSLCTSIIFYFFSKSILALSMPILFDPLFQLHLGGLFFTLENNFKISIKVALIIYLMTWGPVFLVSIFLFILKKKVIVIEKVQIKSYLEDNFIIRNINKFLIFTLFLMSILIIKNLDLSKFIFNSPRNLYNILSLTNSQIFITLPGIFLSSISSLLYFKEKRIKGFLLNILLFFTGKKYYIFLPIFLFFLLRVVSSLKFPKISKIFILLLSSITIFAISGIVFSISQGNQPISILKQLASSFDYLGGFNYFVSMNAFGITDGEIARTSYLFYIPRIFYPDKPEIYGLTLIHERLVPDLLEANYSPSFYSDFSNYLADYGLIKGILIRSFQKSIILIPLFFKEIRNRTKLFISYTYFLYNPYVGIITFLLLSFKGKYTRNKKLKNK